MKKLVKALSLIIITCILCFSVNAVMAEAETETMPVNENKLYLENQDASNDAYNRMLEAFGVLQLSGEMNRHRYPAYYAGAYIGKDGNLVVLTKNASVQEMNILASICNNSAISFAKATYSYNELIDVLETFTQRVYEIASDESLCKVVSLSIRDDENKVVIGLSDFADVQYLSALTDGIDSGCYSVCYTGELQEMAALKPGDYIDGSLGGSAAYKARLTINGEVKTGFVTAAHVTGGSNVYSGAVHLLGKIGNTIVEQNSGSVDAAFVELTGSNTFANTVNGYQLETEYTVIPAIGSTVYKIGSSSGTTSGVVYSNLNVSYWLINGQTVTFTDLVETSVPCVSGDSGGLMYSKNGNSYRIIGIIKGGSNSDGKYYATKASCLPWNITIIS